MAANAAPQPLSRERILEVALGIARESGLEALSMRRLAQELDVWPMSVYRYFRDKEELLDAVAARATDDVALPSRHASWRARMRDLLHEVRGAIAGEPIGVGGRLPRAFLTPGMLRVSEAGLAILDAAGFSKQEAASAWRALWSYTFGSALFRVAATPAEASRRTRAAIAALPDDDFPALLAGAGEIAAAMAGEESFDYGLERLLDGLEARLATGHGRG